MPDNIDETLRELDRGDRQPGTMREGRKEFQAPVTRPDDRPQAGQTMMERLKGMARFGARQSDRDRKETR